MTFLVAFFQLAVALQDPGAALIEKNPLATAANVKAERLKVWAKPALKVDVDKLRADRVSAALARMPQAPKAEKLPLEDIEIGSGEIPPFTVMVFPDRKTADIAVREIAATPDITGGTGPVWLWYPHDSSANVVSLNCEAGGRCATAYWWKFESVDVHWLEAYTKAWGVTFHDSKLPEDWKPDERLLGDAVK